jgi:hypothetical protein
MRSIGLLISLLVINLCHGKEIYYWVDKDGKKHFSDSVPSDTDNIKIFDTGNRITSQDRIKKINIGNNSRDGVKSRIGKNSNKKKKNDNYCKSLNKRKKNIQAQLRKAHTSAEGVRLRRQKRSVSDLIYKSCR